MIFSVYRHDNRDYAYFEAPWSTPPHGWFRRPFPGHLRRPEEIAARLPENAVPVGSGPLPRGIIATDFPNVGSVDRAAVGSGKETGLGAMLGAMPGPNTLSPSLSRNPWDEEP